jgi:TldD protein
MAIEMLETLGRRIGDARCYAELRWQTNESTQLHMRRGALLVNASNRQSGVSARCYRDGLFGFAARPASDDAALARVLRDAADNAGMRGRAGRALGPLPVTAPGLGAHDYRSTRPLLSTLERIDLLRRLDAYIAETYPGLVNADLSLGTTGTEKALVTTEGAATYSYVPRTSIAVMMSLQANDCVVDAYDVFGGFGDADAALLDEAAIRAGIDALHEALRRKAEGTYCEAGLHDVVLAPLVTGILAHEAIGHTCEADAVIGGSVAGDHLGQMVAAESVTLVDYAGRGPDGGASVAIHVDDEGTPCRDVAIIERGVLKGFLHDKETALRLDAVPTGNARAFGFADHPIVRMRNTAIAPGTARLADMIASIDRGYFLQRATNGQADSTGEFMFGISIGYEIRGGKLGRAIRDTTISGVAFDMLKTVTHVGDTLDWAPGGWCGKGQWIQVGMGGPHIACKVTVGGR